MQLSGWKESCLGLAPAYSSRRYCHQPAGNARCAGVTNITEIRGYAWIGIWDFQGKIENLADTMSISTIELPQMWGYDILSFKIFSSFGQYSCRDPYILIINQSKYIIYTSVFLHTSYHSQVFCHMFSYIGMYIFHY